jgi:stearoyl-CoA desaturase (delta-9 desaturase)
MAAEVTALAVPGTRTPGLNWKSVIWVTGLHAGVLLAPFTFTWSGLAVFGILYVVTGLGVTLGYHRLLTHRSFKTPRAVEYVLTLFGVLANEGGPLKWVGPHRKHHTYADREGDPHSPRKGFWWAHVGWWLHYDPVLDDPVLGVQNVKDLARDPVHRFFEKWQIVPPLLLAGALYGLGEWWGGVGLSWVVWGVFVRTVFVFHATWLVNSAAHIWGYRNYQTNDRSTNLWWVALVSFGEGWHNNHHAYQRSARHGLRWWEIDPTYLVVCLLGLVGLAREIRVAPKPTAAKAGRGGRWRTLFPGTRPTAGTAAGASDRSPD